MLIIFAGLPGTGKTTLARALAARTGAVYLRVDTIEHALTTSNGSGKIAGPEGYVVAYALATENLRLGRDVIADSVNPVPETRDAWRTAGEQAGAEIHEIEIVCSDMTEHRRRVETRGSDIDGFRLPSWQAVLDRDYRTWRRDRIAIDTAGRDIDDCLSELCARLGL